MNFGTAISTVFSKYATFRGVASRSEYWWFALFTFLVGIVFNVLMSITGESDGSTAGGPVTLISGLWSLAIFLPSLAVQVRRFHDAGFSGKWLLLYLVPLIAFVASIATTISQWLSYSNGNPVFDPTSGESLGLFESAFIPLLLSALIPLLILAAIGIFTLVVCLLPSKSAAAGNKYAA